MKRFCYLALFLLVWSTLGACVPITPRPEQVIPEGGSIPETGELEAGELEADTEEDLSANPDFILLTGMLEDIRAVIENVNSRNNIELLTIQSLDDEANLITIELGDDQAGVLTEVFELEPKENFVGQGPLTIAKIGVPVQGDPTDLGYLLAAIEQVQVSTTILYDEGPISLPVYAELDLATAVAAVTIDPNSIGAHAYGPPVVGGGDADDFWEQWAFGPYGIGLFSSPGDVASHPICNPPNSSSTTPLVVVFDTVPFRLTDSIPLPTHVQIPLQKECFGELDLAISAVVPASTPSVAYKQYHGLFASALVHAVAPESQIHLVRVLQSDGTGYVSDLLKGIVDETDKASNEPLTPTVFNFSLGIHPDAELTSQSSNNNINMNLFRRTPLIDTDPEMDAPDFLHPETEIAVQLAIWDAWRAGIMMVAASGNDDSGEQYPAAFVPVLGVGAYGPAESPVKACYSNLGDVYAPGGESLTDAQECDSSVLKNCPGPECPNAVVSMIGWPTNWRTAYWSGTSFAAPLASGMVALQLRNLTSLPSPPSDLVDSLVSQLQDTDNCSVEIDGHCKLDWDQVLNVSLP